MKKISVDIGNGYVKATDEDEHTLHFPTVIREKNERSIFGNNSGLDYQVKIDGIDYYVGKLALAKNGVRTWGNDTSMNSDTGKYAALCSHILSKESENSIELFIGLPYAYFLEQSEGKTLAGDLLGKVYETVYRDETKKITIERVSVYPQGIGAYFYNIYDIHGEPRKGATKLLKALIVDVGYRTMDVVAFNSMEGKYALVQEHSFSTELGVFNVIKNLQNIIEPDYRTDPNNIETVIQMANGVIEYNLGTIDLKPLEEKEYGKLAEDVLRRLNSKLEGSIYEYKNIFLTGGGAKKLYPFLTKQYNIQLQDDCIFCNCKGYMAMENLHQ